MQNIPISNPVEKPNYADCWQNGIPRLETPCNYISCGMTKSGKTHSFRYLFRDIAQNFSYGILFSSTIDLNDDYDFLPKKCKFQKYNPTFVRAMMNKQYKNIVRYNDQLAKNQKNLKTPEECFIIIDDSLGVIDFHHSIFNELFSKSRHLKISCFILIQHMNSISPAMRINSMYTIITKIKANNISSLYELVSCFDNIYELRQFLAQYCVNYNVIMFDDSDPYKNTPCVIFRCPKEKINYLVDF